MAVKIRLKRMGASKAPYYRVVVADSRSPRDGRHIEEIGSYDSRSSPAVVKVKEDRALAWLLRGAQPSETVRSLFTSLGIMARYQDMKQGRHAG
ncbi:MAG: 30S ribosomal protein S16 [Acetobacteraceae bacterium]|nr:30S ribosomal protein S16 [Acetobacteraceae bacterium]